MNTAAARILLLDDDEGVIKDVVCSMRLVGEALIVSRSLDEALAACAVQKPALVLARARMKSCHQAAAEFLARLRKSPETAALPVVVIGTASERALVHLEQFAGEAAVPVEFPSFATQVQRKLLAFSAAPEAQARPAPVQADGSEQKAVQAAPLQQTASPRAEAKPAGAALSLEQKFLAVYSIQMAVLDELKASASFHDAAADEVASLLNEATARVCRSFDIRKRIL